MNSISQPCLFWLDGHYSGGFTGKGQVESPIMGEISCILEHPIKEHVILIDDAREFFGREGYPTLHELQALVQGTYKVFETKDDIIRIHN